MKSSYIVNWIVDNIKLRREIREFLIFSSSYVEFVLFEFIESDTLRRQSIIFDTIVDEVIYRDFINSKQNMIEQSQSASISDVQIQCMLNAIVDKVVQIYIQRNSSQSKSFDSSDSQKQQNIDDVSENDEFSFHWRSKKLNFFDSLLSTFYDVDFMIRNDKNLYYRNVHLFCERIFDLVIIKKQKLIRVNLNTCFRNFVFIWYIVVFNRLKRIDFRNFDFDESWIKKLITRFKSNHVIVINLIIVERYTITDVRNDRDSSEYVQQIVNNVKNVNFHETQQQLIWA